MAGGELQLAEHGGECGLVVGAWWGRARWLIAIALPLALVLAMASLVDVPFRHGFGRRTHLPESLRQVRDEYRLGVVPRLRRVDLPVPAGS